MAEPVPVNPPASVTPGTPANPPAADAAKGLPPSAGPVDGSPAAPPRNHRWVFLCFAFLTLLAGLALWWETARYEALRSQLETEEISQFRDASASATKQLDTAFSLVKVVADRFAGELTAGRIPRDALVGRIRSELASQTRLSALGVAYGPFTYAPEVKAWAQGFHRDGQGLVFDDVAASESYQEKTPRNVWFNDPLEKGARWNEPYFDPVASATIVEYAVPFQSLASDGRTVTAGIVWADLSMDDVRGVLGAIDLGVGGYGAIISRNGKYLAHPLEEYAQAMRSALDDEVVTKNPELKEHVERSIRGEAGYLEFFNDVTGNPSMAQYTPIPSTGWTFWVYAVKDYDLNGADQLRRRLIAVTLFAALFLLLLGITVLRAFDGQEWKLWLIVAWFAVLMVGSIGVVWYLALHYTPYRNASFLEIPGRASLHKFQEQLLVKAREMHEPMPSFVPTGFFIQSVNFESANDVKMTGYVWQKYRIPEQDGLTRGIKFPEAVDATLTEEYRVKRSDIEVVGWSFSVTLRQQFEYARYPLDDKDVWIRAISAEFAKNVVLVPDLEAYPIFAANSMPGIARDIVLAGWDQSRSFYSYALNRYPTDFGLPESSGKSVFPEMYFTLLVKRNFLAPFITYVLPIMIIACILFTVLLMSTRDEKKNEMFQFSIAGVIATCSGLFFSVLVAHSQLRGAMMVNGLMYLEFFCFVLYMAILAVACNAFLFGLDMQIDLVRRRDNMIPKLLFWPIFLGLMLLVTIRTFY